MVTVGRPLESPTTRTRLTATAQWPTTACPTAAEATAASAPGAGRPPAATRATFSCAGPQVGWGWGLGYCPVRAVQCSIPWCQHAALATSHEYLRRNSCSKSCKARRESAARMAPAAAPAAPGVSVPYTATSTNATFYLNTTRSNFTYAESMCMRNGGHLAAFVSDAEQVRCRATSHCHCSTPGASREGLTAVDHCTRSCCLPHASASPASISHCLSVPSAAFAAGLGLVSSESLCSGSNCCVGLSCPPPSPLTAALLLCRRRRWSPSM
jgi:hypothetical protein